MHYLRNAVYLWASDCLPIAWPKVTHVFSWIIHPGNEKFDWTDQATISLEYSMDKNHILFQK